jgi:branched-subunit amino acid ABC-type transport system permease component
MQTVANSRAGLRRSSIVRVLLALPIIYLIVLFGQTAGLDVPKIIDTIRNDPGILVQQLINGLANGAIIAIIALGYTLVYGIIELVNFANSDVFMLGTFTALVSMSPFIIMSENGGMSVPWWAALIAFFPAMAVGALLNVTIERVAYRRLRNAPKLIVLISALGMSFILQNIGLQLGAFGKLSQAGEQFKIFEILGSNNAAPKSFPYVFSNDNLLDYVFPPEPTPEPVAGVAAAEDEMDPDALMATANAAIEQTMAADDATRAAMPPEAENAEAEATPALPEAEATPSPEEAVAAEEEAVVAEEEAVVVDEEPTPDIIATMEAESGEAIVMEAPVDASSEAGPQKTRIRITFKDVLVITLAIVLMLVLRWFIDNTKMGKAMRATAQNRDAAKIMGIDVDRVIAFTFAVGGALAGAAGMMTGIYNGTFVFTMGFTAGLRSFTAAVLGGIGNITGAALGGILIGILAAFSDQFLSVRWTNAWIFLVLVLVMLFRPTGLMGKQGGEKA